MQPLKKINFRRKYGTVFICDLRNSTKLYKNNEKAKDQLPKMLKEIFEESYKVIFLDCENEADIHFNDTGDGFICGFTGKNNITVHQKLVKYYLELEKSIIHI